MALLSEHSKKHCWQLLREKLDCNFQLRIGKTNHQMNFTFSFESDFEYAPFELKNNKEFMKRKYGDMNCEENSPKVEKKVRQSTTRIKKRATKIKK
jgi:hypothetical protein